MSGLPTDIREFVKGIGETRSKQEEDRLVHAELLALKDKFLEKGLISKKIKELLFKVIFVEMLGYEVPFSYIFAVNLTQSKALKEKRLGYLACTLFFTHSPDFLIMLVRTIQKDLESSSVHEVVMGLTTLHRLMNKTLADPLTDQLIKLMNHPVDLVRKKVFLCLQAIEICSPGVIPDYKEVMRRGLCDKEPSVMFAALSMCHRAAQKDSATLKDICSSFVIILKQIIDHKLSKDFDFHLLPSPWMQIKLMKILGELGKNDRQASEQIYEILLLTIKRSSDSRSNIALAVSYQAVATAALIYPDEGVLEAAAACISTFVNHDKITFKVMGIKLLSLMAEAYPQVVEQHQFAIVDCLEVKDETMKKYTLDLLMKIASPANVAIIVQKMKRTLLATNDEFFRKQLVNKIFRICEQSAPSHQWFIQNVVELFGLEENQLSTEQLTSFLTLLYENFNEQGTGQGVFVLESIMPLLAKPHAQSMLVLSWVFGQIGASQFQDNPDEVNALVRLLLQAVSQNQFSNSRVYIWVMDALGKLSSCMGFDAKAPELGQFFDKMSKHPDSQVSLRASELKNLSKFNVYLRCSNMVEFDSDMKFLEGYLQLAKKQNAKPYQRASTSFIPSTGLVYTPYPKIQQTGQSTFKTAGTGAPTPNSKVWVPESEMVEQAEQPKEFKKAMGQQKRDKVERPDKPFFKGPTKKAPVDDPKLANKQLLSNALMSGLSRPQPAFKTSKKETKDTKEREQPKSLI